MRSPLLATAALALALGAVGLPALAQIAPGAPTAAAAQTVTPAQRDAVVAAVKAAYKASYVFPDKIPAILAQLDKAKKAGRYDVADANELAGRITADLREASHDGHAYLQYDPARFAAAQAAPAAGAASESLDDYDAVVARRANHGLVEERILPGNVRYLKIAQFHWVTDETGFAYDDALRFLKGGDAAVIDLRTNGGGSSAAIQYLVSHFLKADTLEITFLEAGHEPVQTRTLEHLPAGRMIGKPLYVLIDRPTGSAAESFAYDVQQFKLGTLVGASTAGAANNNEFTPIAPGFMLSVSTGRPVHPVSKSNWEGTGVAPDVAVDPAQALDAAHALALKALSAAPNATAEAKADYAWAITGIEARLHPVSVSAATLAAAPGAYGKYVVTADKDGLLLARPGHPLWPQARRLQPLTAEGLFAVDGIDILRVAFKADALELWWQGEAAPRVMKRN